MGLSQTADLNPWAMLLAIALLLFGAGWLWSLSRGRGPGTVPRRLERLPSAGIFGAGTPPLSAGLQVWEVAPDQATAVVGPLVGALARHHRVLLAMPDRTAVVPVAGGPVYRVTDARPRHLGELCARLADTPGLPVAVVMLGRGRDAADLRASQVALPDHVGGVVVLAETARCALPVASLVQRAGGWRLDTDAGSVALAVVDGCLVRDDVPSASPPTVTQPPG